MTIILAPSNEQMGDQSNYDSYNDDDHYGSIGNSELNSTKLLVNPPADSRSNRQPVSPCNLLLKQFTLRHHMTQDALSDLLKLLVCCS